MLVTINPQYKGTYGHYIPELGTVSVKRAGCEPFDEDPEIARKQIKNGVMVAVNPATVPVVAVEETKPVVTETVDEAVDDLVDEAVDEVVDDGLDDLSLAELRAAAKERGISSFGVKKAALIEMIREYDSKDAPDLGAIDPV